MKFSLIDRITRVVVGRELEAVRALSLGEEYLSDHFPGNPVMPGVLMLEAVSQAAGWLIRISTDFDKSMVLLKEARNVKYGQFVEPGQTLTVQAEILKSEDGETKLKTQGTVDGQTTVSARLVLARYNLADSKPDHARIDTAIKNQLRQMYSVLREPDAVVPERLPS